MAKLGKYGDPCVERHSALIFDRGGKRRIDQILDLNSVEWNREMDRKSLASLTVTGRACREQSALLKSIEPRRHELVLFRGDDRVWEGPILQTKSTSNSFTLDAADIIEYLDKTALTKAWPNSSDPVDPGQTLMTERIRELIEYELFTSYTMNTGAGDVLITRWEEQDPPVNIWQYMDIRTGTTLTTAETEAFQMSLGQHLYNLGGSVGVNYTTIGRRLVVWDGDLARTRTVTEKDFSGEFTVVAAGTTFYNVAHVASTTSEEGVPPVVGHAYNDRSYYGPWEEIITTESENPEGAPDQAALNSQARRALSNRFPLPIILEAGNGSSLIPSAGLTMSQLVAGTEIPVRASNNLRGVKQVQRLDSMKVTETASGESISVNLTPQGDLSGIV